MIPTSAPPDTLTALIAKLPRYDHYDDRQGGGMMEHADGDYVRWDELEAALAASKNTKEP